jgi:DNA polymerase III epsilon subunit-like protein
MQLILNTNKQFMLDIETTGVDPAKEEVLQIAIVEINFENGLWSKGKVFNFFQNTEREPTSKFAKEHMQDLYKFCQNQPKVAATEVRQSIVDFCKDCGAIPPNIFFCGWNAGIFDIPFLAQHGYIVPAKYEEDRLVGDCHYRVYELSGAIQFFANLRHTNEVNPLIKESLRTVSAPKGNKHDALYDCERQIAILNGLLTLARKEKFT